MELKAFEPRSRLTFAHAFLNEASGRVRVTPRRHLARKNVVLLPKVGVNDVSGKPVYLGDAFTRTVDCREETYIVGPLPAAGELVTSFELRPFKAQSDAKLMNLGGVLPLTPDVVSSLVPAGNVFENFEQFVPHGAHYCYTPLGWNGSVFHLVSCPFWQSSDHGMVYCRLRQIGSLRADRPDEVAKARAHFGSDKALQAADQSPVLFDQVKGCGVNADHSDDEDAFD